MAPRSRPVRVVRPEAACYSIPVSRSAYPGSHGSFRPRGMLAGVGPILALIAGLWPGFDSAGAGLAAVADLRQGRVGEWRIDGVPAATNVFDPDVLAVDVTLTEPDGTTRAFPAFWYRPYRRELRSGAEVLTATGAGEWRCRAFLAQAGEHRLQVSVGAGGAVPVVLAEGRFTVATADRPFRGAVTVAPGGRYFTTADGRALPLVGADTCWHGARGTYDYDAWFPAMAGAGWNWGRLWMWPVSFGLETAPAERLNYRLDRAWQLDRVMSLAEEHGLVMLLCLDYHGMFESQPDYWGGNNYWPKNPYNAVNGGPCATARDFFTSEAARRLYQKRLRYLIARYGPSPALFAWQFFNEIDNVYRYLDATEVARWHDAMGTWLHAHDPWRHLVTTSLTSQSDRPEIWSVPALDFAVYHSYSEAGPARRLATVVDTMRRRYGKPVLVGEAGVDWRGWARESDPFLRGFRQLVWGGVMSGSAGTSMSWWWENIHSENAYPVYRALTNILSGSRWGQGVWEPLRFRANALPPDTVGEVIPGGAALSARLVPDLGWGTLLPGQLAVADARSADYAPQRLNAFVHGTSHADLRRPFRLDAWFGAGARLVVHLNSVSDGAILAVRVDGAETFRRSLPNTDGKWEVNNEYNEDIAVTLPAGHHLVEIRNAGGDWFYLDWVRLEAVRPARYGGDWSPAPVVTGIRREGEALLYCVAPGVEYPAQATTTNLPASVGLGLVVSNLPAGDYAALWFRTTDGKEAGRSTGTVGGDGTLRLELPGFTDDLVGHLMTPPTLRTGGVTPDGDFRLEWSGVRAEAFALDAADPLPIWERLGEGRPVIGGAVGGGAMMEAVDPGVPGRARRFYRLRFTPGTP